MIDRKINFTFSLSELGLLTTEPDHEFDNLTQLASELLSAPVSLVSIIDKEQNRQSFKSQTGLPEPVKSKGETPLSHSFCQHVVSRNIPLVINDARQHMLVQDNPAIEELGVIAYMGIPIHTPDGNPIGALCVIDGSSRKWRPAEEQQLTRIAVSVDGLIKLRVAHKTSERLQNELQEFSTALSHDIKSPIRSLVLIHREITESLGDSINADTRQLMELCQSATDRATQLVENILSFTRLFENMSVFELIDLKVLVEEVLDSLGDQIKRTGAQITTCELPRINGNKELLHALLTQLISNALVYTHPKQAPCIDIFSQLSSDGKTATIRIRDTGIGIAPEFHERVFKLFERLHLSTVYPGHGIGLTLCQRIVDIHSGAIEIQSTDGLGTEIFVDLPVQMHE